MPAADRALGQEEVNGRERRARSSSIRRRDLRAGPEDLPKKPTLGMRAECQGRDQVGGSGVHGDLGCGCGLARMP